MNNAPRLLSLLLLFLLPVQVASAEGPRTQVPNVGRYQLVSVPEEREVFLLDTIVGQVWRLSSIQVGTSSKGEKVAEPYWSPMTRPSSQKELNEFLESMAGLAKALRQPPTPPSDPR